MKMGKKIPEISASHEKKVMKSIEKTGHYEMPEKRKKELSKIGTSNGYMKREEKK